MCHDEASKIPVSSVFQYVIFPHGGGPSYHQHLTRSNTELHGILLQCRDAHNDGSSIAEFRLVNCDYVLPESQKSIAEKFKLKTKERPTIFVSGAIGEPKQVPSKHLKTGNMLLKALRSLLEPKAGKVETTQDLRNKCLDQDICGLLLKGTKQAPAWLKDAMGKFLSKKRKG